MKHVVGDGKGDRLVILNGIEVEKVIECEEGEHGYVKRAKQPFDIVDGEVVTVTQYGHVEVRFI